MFSRCRIANIPPDNVDNTTRLKESIFFSVDQFSLVQLECIKIYNHSNLRIEQYFKQNIIVCLQTGILNGDINC